MCVTAMALMIRAALFAGAADAQKITATIVVDDSGDAGGDPAKCALREALNNVNFASKVGVNSCLAGAKTLGNEATLIDLTGIKAR